MLLQFHDGCFNDFQWDYLRFFVEQGESEFGATPTASVDALMRMLRIKCGPQLYGTLAGKDSLRFVYPKSVERYVQLFAAHNLVPLKSHSSTSFFL